MDAFSQAVPFPSDGMQGSGTKIDTAAWLVNIAPMGQVRVQITTVEFPLVGYVQQVALAGCSSKTLSWIKQDQQRSQRDPYYSKI